MTTNNQKTIFSTSQLTYACVAIGMVLLSTLSVNAAENKEPEPAGTVETRQGGILRSSTFLGHPLLDTDDHLSIGFGVAWATSPFKGVDDEILPFPDISYQNGNFFMGFEELGYTVYSQETCAISLLGSWRSADYDSDDSSFLKGMEDRDLAIEAGAMITMETFLGDIGISALSDVSGKHKGQTISAQYSIGIGDKGWGIEAVAGVSWQSEKVVDYYYGVRRSEVRNDRAYYKGKSTFSPSIGINGIVEIYGNLALQAGLNCEFLGSGITDSPLIEDDYVLSSSLSLSYSF